MFVSFHFNKRFKLLLVVLKPHSDRQQHLATKQHNSIHFNEEPETLCDTSESDHWRKKVAVSSDMTKFLKFLNFMQTMSDFRKRLPIGVKQRSSRHLVSCCRVCLFVLLKQPKLGTPPNDLVARH